MLSLHIRWQKLSEKKLPKVGDTIPIESCHVSKMNMRYGEPFGNSEEDRSLVQNLRRGKKLVQKIIMRPEDKNGYWKPRMNLTLMKGYGVVVGSRRFQGSIEAGFPHLEVGKDCWIEEMTDEEAMEASWIENLDPLRKNVDPVLRAKEINKRLATSTLDTDMSLRRMAARWGVPASTLSEWRRPGDLSPKLQKALSDEKIFFTDAVQVARLGLGEEKQNELAELAQKEGQPPFKAEVSKLSGEGFRRGIPAGKYNMIRVAFDKRYKPDMEIIEKLNELAEAKHMKRDEYAKWVLKNHIESA